MAGLIEAIIPRLAFDFTALADNTTQEIVLAKAIVAFDFRVATLIVRYYGPNNLNFTGQTLDVIVRSEAPSLEDPGQDFVSADVASVRIDVFTVSQELMVNIPAQFGSHLRVVVKASQPAGGASSVFKATFSVALVLNDA